MEIQYLLLYYNITQNTLQKPTTFIIIKIYSAFIMGKMKIYYISLSQYIKFTFLNSYIQLKRTYFWNGGSNYY